ncbi:LmrA/YxaF family transcription factor [Streptomyces avermitilis]|uniref:LmrA/YxaF family transcription factor n=1 Tax=Streptomyces avermitilis TaxID=33903 RepID=UPI00380D3FFC
MAAVDAFFVLWRDRLVESGFRAGCPMVAVAVETNDDARQLARSAAVVCARWQEALAALFVRHGLTEERSRRLGAFIIAAVEGAVIMCRAEQSTARSRQPPPKSTTCFSMPCATAPPVNPGPSRSPQPRDLVSSARRSRHALARPP